MDGMTPTAHPAYRNPFSWQPAAAGTAEEDITLRHRLEERIIRGDLTVADEILRDQRDRPGMVRAAADALMRRHDLDLLPDPMDRRLVHDRLTGIMTVDATDVVRRADREARFIGLLLHVR